MDQSKISRKLRKCLLQLQKHDPDVEISSVPTKVSDNFHRKFNKYNLSLNH